MEKEESMCWERHGADQCDSPSEGGKKIDLETKKLKLLLFLADEEAEKVGRKEGRMGESHSDSSAQQLTSVDELTYWH